MRKGGSKIEQGEEDIRSQHSATQQATEKEVKKGI